VVEEKPKRPSDRPREEKGTMNRVLLVLLAGLILYGCNGNGRNDDFASETDPLPPPPPSLEVQLAQVDGVDRDEAKVHRFRSLLKQLDAKFIENPQHIADQTEISEERLKKQGVTESLLTIMEGMNQVFDTPVKNQNYKDYIAAYVSLRAKGQSHQEAIQGLKALALKQ
jgi:hypothetical protein